MCARRREGSLIPVLPRHDPASDARAAQLASARAELTYTWDRPPGVACAADVPRRHGYPPGVLAKVAEVTARLAANRLAVRAKQGLHADTGPSTLASCRELFEAIPAPAVAARSADGDDASFAWQRLGGANPWVIRRVSSHVEHLPEAFRTLPSDEGLYVAAAEGRLYIADWSLLAGLDAGAGRYLAAPRCVFEQVGSALRPVALQLAPEPAAPVFRPTDGAAWAIARAHAQLADLNLQETFFHLGRAHFLMEAFALAAERQLAAVHPVHVLLAPHWEGTLAINGAARDKLCVPGGQLETLLDPSLDASLSLVRTSLVTLRLDRALPTADIAARGMDDAGLDFPYRDDGAPIWAAIRAFVGSYLRLYYDDAEVAADAELQCFLDELRSPLGGRLSGMPARLGTVDELADLVAYVIWVASAQHAACNYTQFDMMGLVPNMPAAAFAPPPTGPIDDGDAAWSALLPSRKLALDLVDFFYQQSAVRDNRLGRYPDDTFEDPRVAGPLEAFQRALVEVESAIQARNATRLLPYTCLQPTNLTASIHI